MSSFSAAALRPFRTAVLDSPRCRRGCACCEPCLTRCARATVAGPGAGQGEGRAARLCFWRQQRLLASFQGERCAGGWTRGALTEYLDMWRQPPGILYTHSPLTLTQTLPTFNPASTFEPHPCKPAFESERSFHHGRHGGVSSCRQQSLTARAQQSCCLLRAPVQAPCAPCTGDELCGQRTVGQRAPGRRGSDRRRGCGGRREAREVRSDAAVSLDFCPCA